MGIISDFIDRKYERDKEQRDTAMNMLRSVYTSNTATDEAKQAAQRGMAHLIDNSLGGGGKGKGGKGAGGSDWLLNTDDPGAAGMTALAGSGGGNGAVKGGGHSIGHILSTLAHGALTGVKAINPVSGLDPLHGSGKRAHEALAMLPSQTEMTADQIQQLQDAAIEHKAQIQAKIDKAKAAADLVTDENKYNAAFDRLTKTEGHSPKEAREMLDKKAGYGTGQMDATERQEWSGPNGVSKTTYRDPHTGLVYDEDTRQPVDLTALKLQGFKPFVKETEDATGDLKSHEARLRAQHPDWDEAKVKLEASKTVDAEETKKAEQAQQRINITLQNSAAQNAPSAPGTMATLAQEFVRSGGKVTIPLPYRGPEKRQFDEAVAAEIQAQKAQGNDTSLAERRINVDALESLKKAKAGVEAGVAATNKEIDRAKFLAKAVPLTKIKRFNSLMQLIDSNVTDDPDLAAFREALVAARSRYNSMITSMRAGGGSATNQVRTETLEHVLNSTMQPETLQRALDEMKRGIGNVLSGYDDVVKEHEDLVNGNGGAGGSTGGSGAKSTAATTKGPAPKTADEFLKSLGR
jgi:hypothetical protein